MQKEIELPLITRDGNDHVTEYIFVAHIHKIWAAKLQYTISMILYGFERDQSSVSFGTHLILGSIPGSRPLEKKIMPMPRNSIILKHVRWCSTGSPLPLSSFPSSLNAVYVFYSTKRHISHEMNRWSHIVVMTCAIWSRNTTPEHLAVVLLVPINQVARKFVTRLPCFTPTYPLMRQRQVHLLMKDNHSLPSLITISTCPTVSRLAWNHTWCLLFKIFHYTLLECLHHSYRD